MTTRTDVQAIASEFAIAGEVVAAEPLTAGHINDSYIVTCRNREPSSSRYLLQRINHAVFRDPPRIMQNIRQVTGHIRAALRHAGIQEPARRVLTPIDSVRGAPLTRDAGGNYWRMYSFIECAASFDNARTPEQACKAARAFGDFQKLLADYAGTRLHETIPNFHNTPIRLIALDRAISADARGRVAEARSEIAFVERHRRIGSVLVDLHAAGAIPERIVHNDAKISNVLFDAATGEALCVVDLDTVMHGLSLYDFGDMVRSMTSLRAEDETDLASVEVRVPFFEAIARGYLDAAGGFLNAAERANLVIAGKVITFEQGVRFLTDFLEGDGYYRTSRPRQNLDRCRAQFKLVQSIMDHAPELNRIVASL